MKRSVSVLGGAFLLSVMGAGVAHAVPHYGFAPPTHPNPPWGGLDYYFMGPTTLATGPIILSCTFSFRVRVVETIHSPSQPPPHGDTAQVVAASFGGASPLCATISVSGLPWPVTANSATSVTFSGVALLTPVGNAGPGPLTGTWTNGPPPSITFTGQTLNPGWTFSGTLPQVGTPVIELLLIP